MAPLVAQNDVVEHLQREVLSLQRARKTSCDQLPYIGLGPIVKAFPERQFPTGEVHEFVSSATEDTTATNGFIAALMGGLMHTGKACLWVGTKRTVYPAALNVFGIAPHRVIFIDVSSTREALWVIEEGLKCTALAAVVGEVAELNFTQSRRLQLAVEQSHVTGFIHRPNLKMEHATACVTRWKIKPLPSYLADDMPGVGFPRWDVQLQKVRNGKPGAWQLEWAGNTFHHIPQQHIAISRIKTRIAG